MGAFTFHRCSDLTLLVKLSVVVCSLIGDVMCFNIETDYIVSHAGPRNSMFGFSVAQHKDADGYWVLVGAPEAQGINPEVIKGGSVYKCHPAIQDQCEIIPFDTKGNHREGNKDVDDKSHQWLGASVTSRAGIVAACAPRYVWASVKKNRREPIGNCFILTNHKGPHRVRTYTPCMTRYWGYHRQGNCQAGYGVALSQGGDRLYVGAVGSWYWQGQVFYQNLLSMAESLNTTEAPKDFDMSYMGFSLSMGFFDGDSEEDVAVGVPKGEDLSGKVVLFNHRLQVLYNLTGDQMGSYFGYSIAVVDFDGDGLDDVAVGAPWHSEGTSASMLYEEGQVAFFKHTKQHNFRKTHRISGRKSRAHFGLSLASLGDLNGDGFGDIAVGAPGDGPEGSGGVYIFLGSPSGVFTDPAQVLLAEELVHFPVSTFGWALSGGLDLDGNEYPDLVVGAHESDHAFVFRARPVVSFSADVRIKSESGVFDLESLQCSLQDNTDVPCYPVHFCVSYSGKGVPPRMEAFYSLRLDVNSSDRSARLFFLQKEGHSALNDSFHLEKLVSKCSSHFIYAPPNPRDKLTPLVTELSFHLGDPKPYDDPSVLRPILAPPPFGHEGMASDSIYFQNNCGYDNICYPDLKTTAHMEEPNYVLGSSKNLLLNVRVSNDGEDGYGVRTYIRVPHGVHFHKFVVTHNGAPDDVTPFCTIATKGSAVVPERLKEEVRVREEDEEEPGGEEDGIENSAEPKTPPARTETEKVICEVGNPLPPVSVEIQLHFQPSSADLVHYDTLKFDLETNSSNPEWTSDTMEDNFASVSLPIVTESDVNIRGISWPDADILFNASFFGKSLLGPLKKPTHEAEVGPQVTHIYDVINRGPSNLTNVEIYLLWPSRTLVGDPLLYLTETPVVAPDTIQCDSVPDVNYLGLLTDVPYYRDLRVENDVTHDISIKPSDIPNSRSVRKASDESSPLQHYGKDKEEGHTQEEEDLRELLSCGSTNCTIMKCALPLLQAQHNLVVKVLSRLWVDTIEKLGITDLKISSRLVVLSAGAAPSSGNATAEAARGGKSWQESVTSVIRTRSDPPDNSMSWLIWTGSAVAGLLVLALLILLLWILGFFKRRRPRDEAENELIHRNGTNGKL